LISNIKAFGFWRFEIRGFKIGDFKIGVLKLEILKLEVLFRKGGGEVKWGPRGIKNSTNLATTTLQF